MFVLKIILLISDIKKTLFFTGGSENYWGRFEWVLGSTREEFDVWTKSLRNKKFTL